MNLGSRFFGNIILQLLVCAICPTVGVTGAGAGVDNAWEQEKPEARKMLENAAESHTSGARDVSLRYLSERQSLSVSYAFL